VITRILHHSFEKSQIAAAIILGFKKVDNSLTVKAYLATTSNKMIGILTTKM